MKKELGKTMVSDSLNPYNRSEEASSGMQLGLNTNQVRTKYEPSTNQVKDLILSVSEDYRLSIVVQVWAACGQTYESPASLHCAR